MSKYLITGASGQLGQLAVDELVKRTDRADIIAMVRTDEQEAAFTAKGITTRRGDYTDKASLEAAFAGVGRLLFISSSDLGNRASQHENVVAAAKAAGVGYIAYTSILDAVESPMMLAADHKTTEQLIMNSGLSYTFLRNGWYSENNLLSVEHNLEMGQRFGASEDGKYSFASRQDYAEAAAIALIGGYDGNILELAGDTAITLTEYTAILSDVAGKPVTYVNIPEAALKEGMVGAGLPEGFATLLADSEVGASKGALFNDSKTLSTVIGRPTLPVAETLKAALAG